MEGKKISNFEVEEWTFWYQSGVKYAIGSFPKPSLATVALCGGGTGLGSLARSLTHQKMLLETILLFNSLYI